MWPRVKPVVDSASSLQTDTRQPNQFDPTVYERAAAALREINKSPNASRAFDLAQSREKSKVAEAERDRAKFAAETQKIQLQKVKVDGEERRKTLRQHAEVEHRNLQYKARLDEETAVKAERLKTQELGNRLHLERESLRQNERVREETEERIHRIRQNTAEKEAALKQKLERAKIEAEYVGKTRQERKNADLVLERLRTEKKIVAEAQFERLKFVFSQSRLALKTFLTDRTTRRTILRSCGCVLSLYFGARGVFDVASDVAKRHLATPRLVREFHRPHGISAVSTATQGLVLGEKLKESLTFFAESIKTGRTTQHALLVGPPGCGKTTSAKMIARGVGMGYAVCTGGDVIAAKSAGAREITKMFKWAIAKRRPFLLFIDEAEAFLHKGREGNNISEDHRAALAAFLSHTGDPESRVAVVLATNVPHQLDPAVVDRMNYILHFPKPTLEERRTIAFQALQNRCYDQAKLGSRVYWRRLFKSSPSSALFTARDLDAMAVDIAQNTPDFSGRQVMKLVENLWLRYELRGQDAWSVSTLKDTLNSRVTLAV